MKIDEELKNIEERNIILINKAIEIMKQVTDPKHSLSHMQSVVNYTREILENEENADKEVCIISAYWHDVGRMVSEKEHAQISANMLEEEMKKMGYGDNLIKKCYLAIYKHSWKENPETLEGMIIRDADKIDFVGRERWKTCIDTNCKFNKVLELLPSLRNNYLKLDASKEIFDREIANLVVYLHDRIFHVDEKNNKNN